MKNLKAIVMAALMTACCLQVSAKNHENFMYNSVVENGLTVEKFVYKQENNVLKNYILYTYKYDQEKRMTETESLKWSENMKDWTKDSMIRYDYDGQKVTTSQYKWYEGEYVLVSKTTVED